MTPGWHELEHTRLTHPEAARIIKMGYQEALKSDFKIPDLLLVRVTRYSAAPEGPFGYFGRQTLAFILNSLCSDQQKRNAASAKC